MASSPVVARWELSRRLASRRKELGIDVKTITDALGFSRNYWSAVENDRTLIADDKLRALFDVLHFEEPDQSELLALREESRKKGWWDEFPSLSDEHKRFFGMEAGATRIRWYEGHIVPGVFQTPEYSRARLEADPYSARAEIDLALRTRAKRQERLLNSPETKLVVVVSEAAILQVIADLDTQIRQLEKLHTLSRANWIELRILPLDLNPGIIVGSGTLLFLEYGKPHLPVVAAQEAVRPLKWIQEGETEYSGLQVAWQDGYSRSLDRDESSDRIIQAREHLAQRRT